MDENAHLDRLQIISDALQDMDDAEVGSPEALRGLSLALREVFKAGRKNLSAVAPSNDISRTAQIGRLQFIAPLWGELLDLNRALVDLENRHVSEVLQMPKAAKGGGHRPLPVERQVWKEAAVAMHSILLDRLKQDGKTNMKKEYGKLGLPYATLENWTLDCGDQIGFDDALLQRMKDRCYSLEVREIAKAIKGHVAAKNGEF